MTPRPSRRELGLVLAACALGAAIRLAFVLLTADHALAGDEVEYDSEGRLAAAGAWLHTTCCFGVEHPSLQKMPAYPLWVSALYSVLGPDPDRVLVAQALLSPVTVALAWLLGRRLFGTRAGIAAAVVVAVHPGTWQYETRLYSEALATPATLAALLALLGRPGSGVTAWRAAGVGALVGLNLLVRPTALFLLAGVAVCWWAAAGARRGTALLAVSTAVAALVVLPWSVRNLLVEPDHFVPLSVQAAGGYGTFNADAAADPIAPYKWRPLPSRDAELFRSGPPLSDGELYAELTRRTRAYIADHPESVPQAFFWNGLSRLWDLRRPGYVVGVAPFEGRSRPVAAVALAGWYVIALLALAGLGLAWRAGRRELVLAVAAMAFALSVLATSDGGTRYRAPVEPLAVVLACGVLAGGRAPRGSPASPAPPGPGAQPPSSSA